MTREGWFYVLIWIGMLGQGLYHKINLVLLIAGLAAGPAVCSLLISGQVMDRLRLTRRLPPYLFAGQSLQIDYVLENQRAFSAALALELEDLLVPSDRGLPGARSVSPRVFFARVGGRSSGRLKWEGPSPTRGRYEARPIELTTRAPFGFIERRVSLEAPGRLTVYPRVGQLTRRFRVLHREATETRRGNRSDRAVQQEEYHGLRDYRPGDSPRWIHWRTSARLGELMVKEFEVQRKQDMAILLDPWLPEVRASAEQREAVEEAIRFAATVCLETCRERGRRIVLGWTGANPGLRQGPASIKLLHELLDGLAVLRSNTDGTLFELLDVLPPPILREAFVIIVTTRPLNLAEEAQRSERLQKIAIGRSPLQRALCLDVTKGDLDPLWRPTALPWQGRLDDIEVMEVFDPTRQDNGPVGESASRNAQNGDPAGSFVNASVDLASAMAPESREAGLPSSNGQARHPGRSPNKPEDRPRSSDTSEDL